MSHCVNTKVMQGNALTWPLLLLGFVGTKVVGIIGMIIALIIMLIIIILVVVMEWTANDDDYDNNIRCDKDDENYKNYSLMLIKMELRYLEYRWRYYLFKETYRHTN